MTIGLVAARTGLRASAIRYYEARGLLPVAARRGGKRVYDPSILGRIAVIKLGKAAGLDLTEIGGVLAAVRTNRPGTAWRTPASAKRGEISRELAVLQVRRRVVNALAQCSCATLEDCGRAFADALAEYEAAPRATSRRKNPKKS